MKRNFKIFAKAPIQSYPLVYSLAIGARDLGYNVDIITQNSSKQTITYLESQNIKVHNLENRVYSNPALKYLHWQKFATYCKSFFGNSNNDVYWICGADTGMAIGEKFLKQYKFYFQINELYDKLPFYLKRINKLANIAYKNIVPEYNRAQIFRVWFKLDKLPSILVNKPYFDNFNASSDSNIQNLKSEILKLKENNIVIIYQGNISKDRDMTKFIKALGAFDNVVFLIMGFRHGDLIDNYLKLSNKVKYIKPIEAPFHLEITNLADIGILFYLPDSLNNIYCAPNKTWEYTKYGLALIGNDIPGLSFIEEHKLGVNLNFENEEDVQLKLNNLMSNYISNKTNSSKYFNSIDYLAQLKSILT